MKLHPRMAIVSLARSELGEALDALITKHGLTTIEAAGVLGDLQGRQLMYALRYERHGDYDKKADEA